MKRYVLSILATIGVMTLSLMPIPEIPPLAEVPLWDKWAHFVMYGSLCCVYWFDYFRNGNDRGDYSKWILWIVVLPILLGGLMELCQKYLTSCRSGDLIDFFANSVGVLLAIPLGLFLVSKLAKRFSKPTADSK